MGDTRPGKGPKKKGKNKASSTLELAKEITPKSK